VAVFVKVLAVGLLLLVRCDTVARPVDREVAVPAVLFYPVAYLYYFKGYRVSVYVEVGIEAVLG
jgi:hypothetical protein